jgi:hypothetical protein
MVPEDFQSRQPSRTEEAELSVCCEFYSSTYLPVRTRFILLIISPLTRSSSSFLSRCSRFFFFFGQAHILHFQSREQTEFTEFITLLALFLVSLSSVKGHQTTKGNIHPHANFQRSYAKGKKKRAFCISFSTEAPSSIPSFPENTPVGFVRNLRCRFDRGREFRIH